MNMDLQDKEKKKPIPLWKSFSYAIYGICSTVRNERNMRIHLIISFLVIGGSIYFSLSILEWMFVVFAIGGMLVLELINTSIERLVDLVTTEYHPLAKQAKDAAAGAVFVFAIVSVIIGIMIFLPRILSL